VTSSFEPVLKSWMVSLLLYRTAGYIYDIVFNNRIIYLQQLFIFLKTYTNISYFWFSFSCAQFLLLTGERRSTLLWKL